MVAKVECQLHLTTLHTLRYLLLVVVLLVLLLLVGVRVLLLLVGHLVLGRDVVLLLLLLLLLRVFRLEIFLLWSLAAVQVVAAAAVAVV